MKGMVVAPLAVFFKEQTACYLKDSGLLVFYGGH